MVLGSTHGSELHSCGTGPAHGADVLAHPEKDFYLVGIKSYGRAPYLPIITRRFARDRLNALAHAQGKCPSGVPEVLFVCVQNAGRSQMAAALLENSPRAL